MIAEQEILHQAEAARVSEWCYLVSLGGNLYALPDNGRTVLLPFISSVPQVTPLPKGLVPPYVLGLINVAQRGEVLIDLPRLLDLRVGPASPSVAESQRRRSPSAVWCWIATRTTSSPRSNKRPSS